MQWFAAHIIMMVKLKNRIQNRFPLWENVVLVRAASVDQAYAKAERRGHDEEGDCDGSFTWNGVPATWVFAGVRKLTTCEPDDVQPRDGTEVTYLEFEAKSLADVKRLVAGKEIALVLRDRFADPIPDDSASDKNGRSRKHA